MKTYILRDTQTVQRQARVQPPATAGEILGRPARPTNGPVLFVGLVHTDTIAVSLAPSEESGGHGAAPGGAGTEQGAELFRGTLPALEGAAGDA